MAACPVTVKARNKGSQKKPLMVVISKKAAKRAVDRNTFKRRVREIMRPYIKKGMSDYTIIARQGAVGISFTELKGIIKSNL